MRSFIMAAAIAVCGGAGQASVVTDTFTSYWALGDSLTDNGNLNRLVFGIATNGAPTSPQVGQGAFYQTGSFWTGLYGRFSNGPTFAEHIAEEFTAAGRVTGNLAYGGAEATEPSSIFDLTPGLAWQQAQLAGRSGQFGDRPLVSLLMGANDIFDALRSSDPMQQAVTVARQAADAVTGAASYLSGFGVGDFLIANLPDIGLTPTYATFQPALSAAATAASAAFNEQLSANIKGLRGAGVNIIELDLFAVIHDMMAQPGDYGFSDVTTPCMFPSAELAGLFGQSRYCSDAESRTRLFFDPVHPNFLAHQQVGQMALTALEANLTPAPIPLPAGAPLMLAGLGALIVFRRRAA